LHLAAWCFIVSNAHGQEISLKEMCPKGTKPTFYVKDCPNLKMAQQETPSARRVSVNITIIQNLTLANQSIKWSVCLKFQMCVVWWSLKNIYVLNNGS
jgi:hypothetical protein